MLGRCDWKDFGESGLVGGGIVVVGVMGVVVVGETGCWSSGSAKAWAVEPRPWRMIKVVSWRCSGEKMRGGEKVGDLSFDDDGTFDI